MLTLELNIPDNIALENKELANYFAAKLYEDKLLSSEQCANMLGISIEEFITSIGKYKVSFFDENKFLSDLENA